MKITDVISKINKLYPNAPIDNIDIIEMLDRCDKQIKLEIMDIREDAPEFAGYDRDTDEDTVLLVSNPYDDLYIDYVRMQIEKLLNNSARTDVHTVQYNARLDEYRNWYNRQHGSVDIPLLF